MQPKSSGALFSMSDNLEFFSVKVHREELLKKLCTKTASAMIIH